MVPCLSLYVVAVDSFVIECRIYNKCVALNKICIHKFFGRVCICKLLSDAFLVYIGLKYCILTDFQFCYRICH
jgi:hypothetical protein